ncbi:SAM-dependent methyltransferase [Nocardioides sp. Root140]|nr:SAM-dependent methyltransferase [Nocardioides sp. Root140]
MGEHVNTEELGDRLFASLLGCLDIMSVYVGDRFGLYRLLRPGALTSHELAAASGMHPRYTQEWLEQQCVAGFVAVDDAGADPAVRRYGLPPGHVPVFADPDSEAYFTAFARLAAAAVAQMPALLEAYRTGGGVGWAEFGAQMRTAQAEGNRPLYLHSLGRDWLPAVPEIHAALGRGGAVADIGCGEGWSSIGMALAYPKAVVHGYDVDEASVLAATEHARSYGVDGRVTFHHRDLVSQPLGMTYDVVTAFECIHDLPDPVAVLAAAREILAPGGTVLVMDERVPEAFNGPGDPVEHLMYNFSMFVCLPDSMSHTDSVATGTVMRPATLERYAREAGFKGAEVLPIENDMFRFYRLPSAD